MALASDLLLYLYTIFYQNFDTMAPYENSTRALVCLKATGKSSKEVSAISGIPTRTVDSIYARAIERGFEPCERPMKLLDRYLEDAPRSGRPSKQAKVL